MTSTTSTAFSGEQSSFSPWEMEEERLRQEEEEWVKSVGQWDKAKFPTAQAAPSFGERPYYATHPPSMQTGQQYYPGEFEEGPLSEDILRYSEGDISQRIPFSVPEEEEEEEFRPDYGLLREEESKQSRQLTRQLELEEQQSRIREFEMGIGDASPEKFALRQQVNRELLQLKDILTGKKPMPYRGRKPGPKGVDADKRRRLENVHNLEEEERQRRIQEKNTMSPEEQQRRDNMRDLIGKELRDIKQRLKAHKPAGVKPKTIRVTEIPKAVTTTASYKAGRELARIREEEERQRRMKKEEKRLAKLKKLHEEVHYVEKPKLEQQPKAEEKPKFEEKPLSTQQPISSQEKQAAAKAARENISALEEEERERRMREEEPKKLAVLKELPAVHHASTEVMQKEQ